MTGWRVNTTAASVRRDQGLDDDRHRRAVERQRPPPAIGHQPPDSRASSSSGGPQPRRRRPRARAPCRAVRRTMRPCCPRRWPRSGRRGMSRPAAVNRSSATCGAHRKHGGGAGVSRTSLMTVARAASSGSAARASFSGAAAPIAATCAANADVVRQNPGGTRKPRRARRSSDAALPPTASREAWISPNHCDRVGGRGDGHVHARISRSRGSDRKSRASVATAGTRRSRRPEVDRRLVERLRGDGYAAGPRSMR